MQVELSQAEIEQVITALQLREIEQDQAEAGTTQALIDRLAGLIPARVHSLSRLHTRLRELGYDPVPDQTHNGPRLLLWDRLGVSLASPGQDGCYKHGTEIEIYDEETAEHEHTTDPDQIPNLIQQLLGRE